MAKASTHRPLRWTDRAKMRGAVKHLRSRFHSVRQAAHAEIKQILARYERGRPAVRRLLKRLFGDSRLWGSKPKRRVRNPPGERDRDWRPSRLFAAWLWKRARRPLREVQERWLRRAEARSAQRDQGASSHRHRETGRSGWGARAVADDPSRDRGRPVPAQRERGARDDSRTTRPESRDRTTAAPAAARDGR